MARNPDAVTAAVEAAKSSPIAKGAEALGMRLVPSEFNVYAADCCGRFYESRVATLTDARAHAAEVRTSHPKAFVGVERPSNLDLGCYDGLTLEERDFLDGAECECGDPDCDRPHCCDECGDEMPMGEKGICRPCYREDPMNNPRVDEDRS